MPKLAGRMSHLTRELASSLVILATALVLTAWLSTGCASGVTIRNNPNTSLNTLQFVITQALPGGVRVKSQNQREFFSNYFSPDDGAGQDASLKRERAYAHVTILGDGRPYRTEIRVYRERKTNSGYNRAGLDKNLSREIAARIQDGLVKSRGERNVIDDFRPF